MAEASAVEEPDTPERIIEQTTEACARPGAQVADQHAREIDQLLAHAAGGHQRSGEDEERQREQRVGIELREALLREHRHHHAGLGGDSDEADERDAQQDRDADQHRRQQQPEHHPDHCGDRGFSLNNILLRTTSSRYSPPTTMP